MPNRITIPVHGYGYENGDNKVYVIDTPFSKCVISKNYNYIFNKKDGYFERWGKTKEDDPKFGPAGPEILDLEISVNGCQNGCQFCYKNNTPQEPTNMSFETFKTIIDKFPKTLTQIAFGITGVQTNPNFVRMLEYCRKIGIVPNFTLSGMDLTDNLAEKIAKLIGAVAVSAYEQDKFVCYNTVRKFLDLGVKQTNIHLMVSKETEEFVYEVLNDIIDFEMLKGLNAVVFLGVKPKGRARGHFTPLSLEEYQELVEFCLDRGIPFGFDSCSAQKFEKVVESLDKDDEWKKSMKCLSESCESDLFSFYINVKGEAWHCSFSENEPSVECVSVIEAEDFLRDVWYSDAVKKFRERVLATEIDGCRKCVTYPAINVEE